MPIPCFGKLELLTGDFGSNVLERPDQGKPAMDFSINATSWLSLKGFVITLQFPADPNDRDRSYCLWAVMKKCGIGNPSAVSPVTKFKFTHSA
jgi:hypothetical protein